MEITRQQSVTMVMPFAVRPMAAADVGQSVEIERDAFPTTLPPTSFRRELKNRNARYLVAYERGDRMDSFLRSAAPVLADGDRSLAGALARSARKLWDSQIMSNGDSQELIVGYLSTGYIVDEAHIMSVGVRNAYRGRGIGELLLIGAVEMSLASRARLITLEVRESNYVAKNLYRKYGFEETGLRKGYYADNREDAIIMSVGPISSSPCRQLFCRLASEHQERWGRSSRVVR